MKKFKFILLIDDNEVDNLVHKKMLGVMDVADNVHAFLNGLEAINYFRILSQIDICPDLIFVDLSMPHMDGFQFIQEFQNLPAAKKSGKLIVLSSSINLTDIKNAEILGAHAYIVKPLTFSKLKEAIESISSVKLAFSIFAEKHN